MKLDRRRFLKSLGAAGAGVALSALSAVAIDENQYSNSRLRFALRKPDGWVFNSVRDFKKISEDQEPHLARPELQRELLAIAGYPILVVTKYFDDVDPDRFSPNIQVYADPISSESDEEFLEASRVGSHLLGRYFENYRVEREQRIVAVGPSRRGLYDVSFDFLHKSNRYPVYARCMAVRTSEAQLSFSFVGSRRGLDRCSHELEQSLRSVRTL